MADWLPAACLLRERSLRDHELDELHGLSEAEVPPRVLERDGYHPGRRTVVFAARAAAA